MNENLEIMIENEVRKIYHTQTRESVPVSSVVEGLYTFHGNSNSFHMLEEWGVPLHSRDGKWSVSLEYLRKLEKQDLHYVIQTTENQIYVLVQGSRILVGMIAGRANITVSKNSTEYFLLTRCGIKMERLQGSGHYAVSKDWLDCARKGSNPLGQKEELVVEEPKIKRLPRLEGLLFSDEDIDRFNLNMLSALYTSYPNQPEYKAHKIRDLCEEKEYNAVLIPNDPVYIAEARKFAKPNTPILCYTAKNIVKYDENNEPLEIVREVVKWEKFVDMNFVFEEIKND